MTKRRIQSIIDSGANVVFTTKGIDDMAIKVLSNAGVMGVRRVDKRDLKMIAKATGATFLLTMANMEGEEEFEPSFLGEADEVSQVSVSDREMLLLKGCKTSSTSSIVLRGANATMLDEMERAVHDAICIVKRVLESNATVPGGGCVEAAVSVYLRKFAHTLVLISFLFKTISSSFPLSLFAFLLEFLNNTTGIQRTIGYHPIR